MSKSLPMISASAGAVACCAPLLRAPLTLDDAERLAPVLKALADPVRLRLVSLVAAHDGGEACVCDLNDAFDLSQPTISHHLKVLHEAGLLERDKRGVWVHYRVRAEVLADLARLIGSAA
jgi:ArsR family transcriptional regulator, arsenate/arsenite/antimonite-responsive transcriptional repressor